MKLLVHSALALLLLAGCSNGPVTSRPVEPEVVRSTNRFTREYVLQPGDQIEVAVFKVPELTRNVTVRADGFVSLPILKDVKATGFSVTEFGKHLEQRYADRLNDPNVTVTVLNPRQASVYVLGEVPRPGPVAVRDAPTAALALAAVGGVGRSASLENVAVIRLEDDGVLTGYVVKREQGGETAFYMALASTTLKAGDLLIVPESGRSQFVRFIQDFVNTPLTGVSQALSPYFQFESLRIVRDLAK